MASLTHVRTHLLSAETATARDMAASMLRERSVSMATAASMRVTRPKASALSPCALVSCSLRPARRSRQARASASSPATSAVCAAAYAWHNGKGGLVVRRCVYFR